MIKKAVIVVFILKCACGNELYCSNEQSRTMWSCDVCGQWYDMFGYPVIPPEDLEIPAEMNFMAQED